MDSKNSLWAKFYEKLEKSIGNQKLGQVEFKSVDFKIFRKFELIFIQFFQRFFVLNQC